MLLSAESALQLPGPVANVRRRVSGVFGNGVIFNLTVVRTVGAALS